MRLPGHRERFPRVDDHLVEPEVTRDEIVGGRKMEASPAKAPHAGQHGQLDLVVGSHIVPGYRLMVDLLTRHGVDSDFASDSAVVKEGIDPATGTRYLEEIAPSEDPGHDPPRSAACVCDLREAWCGGRVVRHQGAVLEPR